MIVKLREPLAWERYESHSKLVRAIRINEDFLYETSRGYMQGRKGQWLIEHGESVRFAIDDESFKRQFRAEKE